MDQDILGEGPNHSRMLAYLRSADHAGRGEVFQLFERNLRVAAGEALGGIELSADRVAMIVTTMIAGEQVAQMIRFERPKWSLVAASEAMRTAYTCDALYPAERSVMAQLIYNAAGEQARWTEGIFSRFVRRSRWEEWVCPATILPTVGATLLGYDLANGIYIDDSVGASFLV